MKAIPPITFSKTNWLNFNRHHCSSLITNRFNTIIIADSIAAGLNRYCSVYTKYLKPLKTLNFGLGRDRVQNALRRAQNLRVISSRKNVVILYGINYLSQESPEQIADSIIEIAETFQSSYNSINNPIGGILPSDASWSVSRVLIEEVNGILKAKYSNSFFIYIGYDSCWTFFIIYLQCVIIKENKKNKQKKPQKNKRTKKKKNENKNKNRVSRSWLFWQLLNFRYNL